MSEINLDQYDDSEALSVSGESASEIVYDALKLPKFDTTPEGVPVFKSIDEAVRVYIEHRNALKAYMARVKIVEETTKSDMAKISMWMRDKADELGIDSFKTQYGTAFRNVKTSYRMGDWNEFIKWVVETGNTQCLEKRVAKNSTKEIHDADGIVPPGINYSAEVEFDVRSPIKRKV